MSTGPDCTTFLKWALPRMRMRWAGFRKVRGQVCKRIRRRFAELGLDGFEAYRAHIETRADEWRILDGLCRVTISRFFRDRGVFEALHKLLPGPSCWSAGCASGEEPYTLALLDPQLTILATDADEHMLERARAGVYTHSSVADVPRNVLESAFDRRGDEYVLRDVFRTRVEFRLQDIREAMPDRPFDVILCRNLAFTYYDEAEQRRILAGMHERLARNGLLVLGRHETPPEPWTQAAGSIYRAPAHPGV